MSLPSLLFMLSGLIWATVLFRLFQLLGMGVSSLKNEQTKLGKFAATLVWGLALLLYFGGPPEVSLVAAIVIVPVGLLFVAFQRHQFLEQGADRSLARYFSFTIALVFAAVSALATGMALLRIDFYSSALGELGFTPADSLHMSASFRRQVTSRERTHA